MDSLIYWIWLSLHCGAGSESGTYLLSKLGGAKEIYEADGEELSEISGISPELRRSLLDKNTDICERILDYCRRTNVSIMTCEDEIYPKRLASIHAKPLLLYYKGKIPDIDENVLIAIVGTRSCTKYGENVAYKFGAELASGGAIVVSGMALGIDEMAARGALSVRGHTIAVLGCGIDTAYPPQNKTLMEQIILSGTVMTEYAPGTEPSAKNFPTRNRIISGLCQATLVVEADRGSGSLITAGRAVSQGRELYAVPGRIGEKESEGTNELIRRGAKIALSPRDILEEYELIYPNKIFIENDNSIRYATSQTVKVAATGGRTYDAPPRYTRKSDEKPKTQAKKSEPDVSYLTDREKMIFRLITERVTPDEIRKAAGDAGETVETGELLGILTTLEIYGLIEALPGGSYKRA